MKHYYRIADAVIQAGLLAAWVLACMLRKEWVGNFYFIVGAWFFVSLVVHYLISTQKFEKRYRFFANICIALIVLPLPGFIVPFVLIAELYLLLFASPLMALVYTINCFAEWRYLNKRPMSYLK
jgi:hypothetical protein